MTGSASSSTADSEYQFFYKAAVTWPLNPESELISKIELVLSIFKGTGFSIMIAMAISMHDKEYQWRNVLSWAWDSCIFLASKILVFRQNTKKKSLCGFMKPR